MLIEDAGVLSPLVLAVEVLLQEGQEDLVVWLEGSATTCCSLLLCHVYQVLDFESQDTCIGESFALFHSYYLGVVVFAVEYLFSKSPAYTHHFTQSSLDLGASKLKLTIKHQIHIGLRERELLVYRLPWLQLKECTLFHQEFERRVRHHVEDGMLHPYPFHQEVDFSIIILFQLLIFCYHLAHFLVQVLRYLGIIGRHAAILRTRLAN